MGAEAPPAEAPTRRGGEKCNGKDCRDAIGWARFDNAPCTSFKPGKHGTGSGD